MAEQTLGMGKAAGSSPAFGTNWAFIKRRWHVEQHVRDYYRQKYYRQQGLIRVAWWMPGVGFMYGYKTPL